MIETAPVERVVKEPHPSDIQISPGSGSWRDVQWPLYIETHSHSSYPAYHGTGGQITPPSEAVAINMAINGDMYRAVAAQALAQSGGGEVSFWRECAATLVQASCAVAGGMVGAWAGGNVIAGAALGNGIGYDLAQMIRGQDATLAGQAGALAEGATFQMAGESAMALVKMLPVPRGVPGGARGSWATIDEQAGGAVAQTETTSCGAACGEMVSGIGQSELIAAAGHPTDVVSLAKAMGGAWRGGFVNADSLSKLLRIGHPFIAQLQEVGEMAHFVVVDGMKAGELLIRDPRAGGSTYRMTLEVFQSVWSQYVVF